MDGIRECPVVTWFAEDSYNDVLALMEDGATLPSRYDSWKRGAVEQLTRLQQAGLAPATITIDPQAFTAWCAQQDLPPNAEMRLEYADALARGLRVTRPAISPAN